VLILIDTLRADHLGVYGYERNTSPRIDALAEQGVVFDRAYSTTNWTRPAVASLHSSTMPSRHNVTALDRALGSDFRLLAETLRDRGYRTAFFTVGPNIEPADGYGRGVDYFYYGRSQKVAARPVFVGMILLRLIPQLGPLLPGREHQQRSALTGDPEEVTSRALEWVGGVERERPLFMYLHYLGPHSPYRPPPPYDRAFSDVAPVERLVDPPGMWVEKSALSEEDRNQMLAQYDGEILWHDEHIGRLLDGLRSAGRLDRAVVAITADHGEGFGEHGFWGHNASLFEEVVRIPLIVWSSIDEALVPGRRETPVSLMDVTPTLAGLAGVEGKDGFDGVSLVPRLRDAPGGGRTVFTENPLNDEIGVRTPEWAYFEGKIGGNHFGRWLYRAGDRLQIEELSQQFPQVVAELSALAATRREHDRTRSAESVPVELDDERREMLEALGYVEESEPAKP
jgi:arylsulfatase